MKVGFLREDCFFHKVGGEKFQNLIPVRGKKKMHGKLCPSLYPFKINDEFVQTDSQHLNDAKTSIRKWITKQYMQNIEKSGFKNYLRFSSRFWLLISNSNIRE